MKTVKLATFIENPDNPQTVTAEDFALLVESLRTMPQTLAASKIAYVTDYTAVDGADLRGQRVVIAGNKRLRALKQLAADHATSADGAIKFDGPLPAEWFYDLTPLGPDARRAWLIKSNVQSGEWDAEKLLALYDRDELGDLMGDKALEEILKAADKDEPKDGKTDPDAVPDAPETPVSKRGEVYQCGEHRLMCGDSTSAADVTRLMGGEKADMVFTDPPYNVAIGDRNKAINEEEKKHGQKNLGGRIDKNILGDSGMTDEECGEKLWRPAFQNMADNAKDDCAIYVTMPQGGTHMMMMMMMMRGSWQVKHELMWLKNQPTFSMGRLDYDYKHEPICYGWKKSHRFFGKGKFTKSVWEFDKPVQSKLHPTMKPVELICNALENSSEGGGYNSRRLRRFRHDDDCGGVARTQGAAHGIGSALLRRNPPPLGGVRTRRRLRLASAYTARGKCAAPTKQLCAPCVSASLR